jgi:hypothetical protein
MAAVVREAIERPWELWGGEEPDGSKLAGREPDEPVLAAVR